MPILPKGEMSHWTGRIVHKKFPGPLGRKAVEWFAKYYNINLDEAEFPIEKYESIGALFTRKLKPGIRPIGNAPVVHPADSFISQAGVIDQMKMIQAKGKDYEVGELIGNEEWAKYFDGGSFLTYYLCPTDYHRVHCPVDGEIKWAKHIPGEFWPVNEWSVNAISNLFSINERVAVGIETPKGKVVLVMVAATNVGNMTMSFDEKITTTARGKSRQARQFDYSNPISIHKGDEVGIFHMGSTVVMLYERGIVPTECLSRAKDHHVKMGASLA